MNEQAQANLLKLLRRDAIISKESGDSAYRIKIKSPGANS